MDLQARLHDLACDRSHGASELARLALGVAADWAQHAPAESPADLLAALHGLADQLTATRPSMTSFLTLVGRWRDSLASLRDQTLPAVRETAARTARAGIDQSLTAVRDAARHATTVVPEEATLITHSYSSTVVEVFRQLRGRAIHAIVTESRPRFEGHHLASQLGEWEIPVTLITEAQLGLFTPRANLALVGADSLRPRGTVINKAGTSLLALAAHDHGVPFYVCAESFKRRPASMGEVELEEMDPGELGAPESPGLQVANIYFDLTPPRFITGWIDETGITPGPAVP